MNEIDYKTRSRPPTPETCNYVNSYVPKSLLNKCNWGDNVMKSPENGHNFIDHSETMEVGRAQSSSGM
jgi:hypothetical protein